MSTEPKTQLEEKMFYFVPFDFYLEMNPLLDAPLG